MKVQMAEDEKLALGFCWYDKTQWEQLKALDNSEMDETYEEWRKNAAKAFGDLVAEGHEIRKVNIKVRAFLDWCRARGLQPDTEARTQYAAWVLKERDKAR